MNDGLPTDESHDTVVNTEEFINNVVMPKIEEKTA